MPITILLRLRKARLMLPVNQLVNSILIFYFATDLPARGRDHRKINCLSYLCELCNFHKTFLIIEGPSYIKPVYT